MKRSVKRKMWLDRRSRKIQANKKNKKHLRSRGSAKRSGGQREARDTYIAKAPERFSIIHNTEDTARYFADIIEKMREKNYKQRFFIDSSQVVFVTTDALIYILAVLYNIKQNFVLKYSFKGDLPTDSNAKKVYLESGFMNYVKSKRPAMPKTDDKVQILSGHRTEPEIAGNVCDFVMRRYKKGRSFTLDLYKTLIELMSNTHHHAYHKNSGMAPNWYLYAIDLGESIQITFIDTGEGIPNTVRRKLLEKIPSMVEDSKLIYSALLGESRTETRQYNRGRGLPDLREKVMKGSLKNFYVFSGKGSCKSVEEGGEINFLQKEHIQEVFGTIFQFEIQNIKEEIAC